MNTAVAPRPAAQQQPAEPPKQPVEAPIAKFRAQLEQRLSTFAEALPPHITPERFKSVVAWAVTADPGLLAADRVSLFEACLAAANDGLLPDKKQAALVIYNTKVKEDGKEFWIKKVQYMPMIRGIFDKVYNSGQVKTIKVAVVYAGDRFRSWTNDEGDHIEYEEGEEQDRDIIRAAFAQVVMRDGGVFIEVMRSADIEKIRSKSKTSNSGPWVDWWEEMAKKSVFRRLAKRLPMARDLDAVTSRDDVFDQFADDPQLVGHQRRTLMPPRPPSTMLGASMSKPVPMTVGDRETAEVIDPETGEIIEDSGVTAATQTAKDAGKPAESVVGSDAATAPPNTGDGDVKDGSSASPKPPAAAAAPDSAADAIERILKLVTDKATTDQEKLENLELLKPAFEHLTLAFQTMLFATAKKVVLKELTPVAAKRYLESVKG